MEDVIVECIGRQIGTDQFNLAEKLGDAGIDGFALATCINQELGTSFRGSDFPPSQAIATAINLIKNHA